MFTSLPPVCVYALSFYIPTFFTSSRHCWYLAPSVVMFSLFSNNVPDDTKARMAAKLLSLEKPEETRVDLPEFPTLTGSSELLDFVQPNSWEFFDILKVEADWLAQPPVEWEEAGSL